MAGIDQGLDPARSAAGGQVRASAAVIAFLTGDQVHIPVWVDHIGLGWLWRSLSDPKIYGPRYWDARHLAPLMLRYRDRLPSLAG